MRRAAELRRNQTEAEAKLWAYLRAHRAKGVHFRRQYAIGKYIVDFCAVRKKLIIEVDGSQHKGEGVFNAPIAQSQRTSAGVLNQEDYDKERTAFLESKGFHVLRFWNDEVLKNTEGVMTVILDELES
jgi:very-short-patch-repair endonuclease